MVRFALLFFVTAASLLAQRVSFGVKGGIVPTDGFSNRSPLSADESRWYTLGPSVELHLPKEFSIEVDALYRRIGYSSSIATPEFSSKVLVRSNQWEIPVLLKYRFPPSRRIRPFVSAGYAARFSRGWARTSWPAVGLSPRPEIYAVLVSFRTEGRTTHGAVLGAGFEFQAWKLRFSPEVRYTRWNHGIAGLDSQHQAQILFGVSWP